jgi:dihydropteroate synthase
MMQGSRRQPLGLSKDLASKKRCLVVGVLNVTPDSFSDGGLFTKHLQNKAEINPFC